MQFPAVLLAILISGFTPTRLWANSSSCTQGTRMAVCPDSLVQERVDWACRLVQTLGEKAVQEVRTMRYDCCGEPDYVWINDLFPRMITHPMKPTMDGQDLRQNRDPGGKRIFVEFVRAAEAHPEGAWVDYSWTKYGDFEPTPKKSWVKKCKVSGTERFWVVGSGTWK